MIYLLHAPLYPLTSWVEVGHTHNYHPQTTRIQGSFHYFHKLRVKIFHGRNRNLTHQITMNFAHASTVLLLWHVQISWSFSHKWHSNSSWIWLYKIWWPSNKREWNQVVAINASWGQFRPHINVYLHCILITMVTVNITSYGADGELGRETWNWNTGIQIWSYQLSCMRISVENNKQSQGKCIYILIDVLILWYLCLDVTCVSCGQYKFCYW